MSFGTNCIGSIAPSKCADVLILNDLSKVGIDIVIADGVVVAKQGRTTVGLAPPKYPDFVKWSIHLKQPITAEDLSIKAPVEEGKVRVRVIGVIEAMVVTRHLQEELFVKNWEVQPSLEKDVAKVAVVERHRLTGNIGLGFVSGFGFREGAVASSVAHDSHNLLVVGMNNLDMAFAVNKLAELGGGMVAVKDGEVTGIVELPIAGLMSDKPVERVNEQVEKLHRAWVELGCTMASPFMTMSFLALPVLPELRITDKGLVDTQKFQFVELFVG